jgi:hypothetical protein
MKKAATLLRVTGDLSRQSQRLGLSLVSYKWFEISFVSGKSEVLLGQDI